MKKVSDGKPRSSRVRARAGRSAAIRESRDALDAMYLRRYQQGNAEWWEYGLHPQAWRPGWFTSVLHAVVAKLVRSYRGRGHSLRKIARRLNECGPPPRRGQAWRASTVRFLLRGTAGANTAVPDEPAKLEKWLASFRDLRSNVIQHYDRLVDSSESMELRTMRVWAFYEEFLAPLGECRKYIRQQWAAYSRKGTRTGRAKGMDRLAVFALDFWGSLTLPAKSLLEFDARPAAATHQLTKLEAAVLCRHKLREAALRIACGIEGISVRAARERQPKAVSLNPISRWRARATEERWLAAAKRSRAEIARVR